MRSMEALFGALAGLIATFPMTIFMKWMHRRLPKKEQYPLPPREITEEVTQEMGVKKYLYSKQLFLLTMIAHFGYGAFAGLILGWLSSRIPIPLVIRGLAVGGLLGIFEAWAR